MKESLKERSPTLAEEWSEKNSGLTPEQVSYGSNRKVFWKGACGHEWEAAVKNRANGAGCPYCSGNRLLKGFNDLLTVAPDVSAEWSARNGKQADEVLSGSPKKAWWKCQICGGEWEARIADRSTGSGCPYCAFVKIKSGINDFAAWYPDLAVEWSEKNGTLRPERLSAKARHNVWWKCSTCGYEWFRSMYYRAKGSSCPECHRLYMKNEYRRRRRIRESFPKEKARHAIAFYAKKNRLPFRDRDDTAIGLPLMAWFPEKNSAIEVVISAHRLKDHSIPDRIKDDLCRKAGIRLIRILEPNEEQHEGVICIRQKDESEAALSEAIRAAFELMGYAVDVDVGRDIKAIQQSFIERDSGG